MKPIILQIKFLDGHAPIDVENRPAIAHPANHALPAYKTPDLWIGWGDRESDMEPGLNWSRREIQMLPPKVHVDRLADVPAADVERVQGLVDRLWIETPTVAPACESYRKILQGIHDNSCREAQLESRAPAAVARVLERLGSRREVRQEEAESIIKEIAPDENRIPRIIDSLRDKASILLWSAVGGKMRYDQPGTMHHRPELVFTPARDLSLPAMQQSAVVLSLA